MPGSENIHPSYRQNITKMLKRSGVEIVKLFLIRKQFANEIAEARKRLFARGVLIRDLAEIEIIYGPSDK